MKHFLLLLPILLQVFVRPYYGRNNGWFFIEEYDPNGTNNVQVSKPELAQEKKEEQIHQQEIKDESAPEHYNDSHNVKKTFNDNDPFEDD